VIQLNIVHACEQTAHWFPHAVADAVFGVDCATGAVHERLYYAGFAGLSVPCLIVRGFRCDRPNACRTASTTLTP
jgi:hypothetical protein